jgi:hypothetical protein
LKKNSPNRHTKANALLCPSCCVEYVEIEFDFEVDGLILRDVKGLQCPTCGEEQFTSKQVEDIGKRLSDLIKS